MDCKSFLDFVSYDGVSGKFYWKVDFDNHSIGDLAGNNHDGYLMLVVSKKKVFLHRLAWLAVYGEFPKGFIDHINKNRSDNRIENLRDATKVENGMNRKLSSNNKSGFTGVSWSGTHKKWISQISDNKKRILIGYFDDKESAIVARKEKEIELGYL